MAQQYWIGGFYIDLSRNQITQNNESKKLAPKALSLLTYLAQHQGSVVSQDELLAKVWQGSVVSPNTLQRSIAQLRKALGDDGKVQVYIKTHAKKGYSLECDVRWNQEVIAQEEKAPETTAIENAKFETDAAFNNANNSVAHSTNQSKAQSSTLSAQFRLLILAIVITFCVFIVLQFPTSGQTPSLKIGEIRALTATDNKELAGIYSPDGKYIVFHRYSNEFCSNNIWAKDIETQQEFQLTQNLNSYGAHSFSKDGKSLAFVQSETCTAPVTQKKCYYLMNLDFEKALIAPQKPTVLLECKNSEIRKPQWLTNNTIALLQKTTDRWKLISYSITDNESETLYQLEDGDLVDFDYSAKHDFFALFSTQSDGSYYINILKPDGKLVSSNQIIYPPEIAPFKYVYPNFSPFENQLIFSTGRQLFTLSYDGQVKNISLPIDEAMSSPVFHPDNKRLLAIKGQYDSDVISLSLKTIKKASVKNDDHFVIARSTSGEDNGIFKPNSEKIAFKSDRSGIDQLWLTDGSTPQQLSHFPIDTFLYEVHWSLDGESLLANVDKALVQVFLDGTRKTYDFEHQIDTLFDWDSEKETALSLVRIKGAIKFVELNLADATMRILNDKQVNWAQNTKDGAIVFTDHMDRFWQSGSVEDQLIEELKAQGSDKRFVIHNSDVDGDEIYGINEDFQLWSYSLHDERFNVIGDVPKNLDYLTDVNGTEVLMTLRMIARKEVVELLLDE
ncbi:transcriptional regulator [Thalassotalea sp. M1531]|uniref:Transcriptional regulator n=1 Tax=Thalassotalea algicola TaxID=2716224 RepID=A0A7Y0LDY7_9GAMM|nr:winged helix-turn-helix domain-containing protein [Thalassotalea algicola]NMP32790.1 transcriptional regulator [Thalassotalea algicola]